MLFKTAAVFGIICIGLTLQSCDPPNPDRTNIAVKETAPKGEILEEMDSVSGLEHWTFEVMGDEELEEYFTIVTRHEAGTKEIWRLVLAKQLDLETMYPLLEKNSDETFKRIQLILICNETLLEVEKRYNREIKVVPVDEFPPHFSPESPVFNMFESATGNETVADLNRVISDDDMAEPPMVFTFEVHPYHGHYPDGSKDVFTVLPNGLVLLKQPLDYESDKHEYGLNVTVTDAGGLSSVAAVTIRLNNANDIPPYFTYPGCKVDCRKATFYLATVNPHVIKMEMEQTRTQIAINDQPQSTCAQCWQFLIFHLQPASRGPIKKIEPGEILAHDDDSERISYGIMTGSPKGYKRFLNIGKSTGILFLVGEIHDADPGFFSLVIEVRDRNVDRREKRPSPSLSAYTTVLVYVWGKNVSFIENAGFNTDDGSHNLEDKLIFSIASVGMLNFIAFIFIAIFSMRLLKNLPAQKVLPLADLKSSALPSESDIPTADQLRKSPK